MAPVRLAIKNFPKQALIFDCPTRIVVIRKGRRFGFTKGAANNTIKLALSGRKKKGLWVDTVNANIERYVERFFIPHLKKLPEGMWSWQKQQKILKIADFYMDFRSVETPENIEGFGYDYMILNEAGIILKKPYLWDNAIRPMMWDSDCHVFIGGTPKGGGGTFEDLYNRGLDPDQKQFASFHVTSFDNPYVPANVILEDIKSMPELVVKQEIYAEFLDDSGVVFRGVPAIAILAPQEPIQGHMYVVGVDVAKVQDYTVLAVYDRANNHQVFQMRFNQLEWPVVKQRIREVSVKYNHALVILDATGVGSPVYDDLVRDGVPVEPYKFTNTTKKVLVEKLANWIEIKHIKMLNLEETKQEFKNFTYDISISGVVRYEAPVGFNDDIVMAHALAVYSLQPIRQEEKQKLMSIIQKDLYEKTQAKGKTTEDSDEYSGDSYEEYDY